jgi:hypothetical protein
MSKCTITLDEQEQARLEQIVIDDDAAGALKFAKELRKRVQPNAQCRPSALRTAGNVETAIKKTQK